VVSDSTRKSPLQHIPHRLIDQHNGLVYPELNRYASVPSLDPIISLYAWLICGVPQRSSFLWDCVCVCVSREGKGYNRCCPSCVRQRQWVLSLVLLVLLLICRWHGESDLPWWSTDIMVSETVPLDCSVHLRFSSVFRTRQPQCWSWQTLCLSLLHTKSIGGLPSLGCNYGWPLDCSVGLLSAPLMWDFSIRHIFLGQNVL
jgi:hypothetical protein